jgi:hypothetical protein
MEIASLRTSGTLRKWTSSGDRWAGEFQSIDLRIDQKNGLKERERERERERGWGKGGLAMTPPQFPKKKIL